MATIPLEDNFNDILQKAQRGLRLSDEQLAVRAGVPLSDLRRILAGEFAEDVVQKLAPALQLGAAALLENGRKSWRPAPQSLAGLAAFNTVYADMTVNAYLIWDPKTKQAAAFDTGSDGEDLLAAAGESKLKIKRILVTHTHGDHIADLDRLTAATGATVHVSRREPVEGAELFDEGATFKLGNLTIEARATTGHSRGGTTYVVRGLERPVAVVGDALFAGSMGGGLVSYDDALRNNREKILTLPEDTVICPGHGPLTTVGEEKQHNPFFPEFRAA